MILFMLSEYQWRKILILNKFLKETITVLLVNLFNFKEYRGNDINGMVH